MQNENLISWQLEPLGYYLVEFGNLHLSVYREERYWFYCAWLGDGSDGSLIDSFSKDGGAYATAESAMTAAERWYAEWKETE